MKSNGILLTLFVLFTGCMTSNFTLTGSNYEELPEDYPIKVVLSGNNERIEFEEIGALHVKQTNMDDLSKALNLAKTETRRRGGDIVFLISSNSTVAVSGYNSIIDSEEKNTYIFVIGKQNN